MKVFKANSNPQAYTGQGANQFDSNYYNQPLEKQTMMNQPVAQQAAFRGSNSSNFGDMSLPEAPGGSSTPGSSGAINALSSHNLKNRKPTLGNSWGGWSGQNNTTDTSPQNNTFTFFSKFA